MSALILILAMMVPEAPVLNLFADPLVSPAAPGTTYAITVSMYATVDTVEMFDLIITPDTATMFDAAFVGSSIGDVRCDASLAPVRCAVPIKRWYPAQITVFVLIKPIVCGRDLVTAFSARGAGLVAALAVTQTVTVPPCRVYAPIWFHPPSDGPDASTAMFPVL